MNGDGMKEHRVWRDLSDAKRLLESFPENFGGTGVSSITELLRSISVAETLQGVPPLFLDEGKLDDLAAQVQLILRLEDQVAEAQQLSVSERTSIEADIEEQLSLYSEEMASILLSLPVRFHSSEGIEKYEQSLLELTTSLGSMTDHLKEKNAEADELLQIYERRVIEKQEEVEEGFRRRQEELEQHLSILQSSVDDIVGTIETQKNRLDEALNTFSQKSLAQVEATEKKHTELRQETDKKALEQRERIEVQSKAIIDQLTKYEDQASRLVESTAKGTISTEYGALAEAERRSAFWWSVATVIVACFGLGALVYGIGSIENATVSQTIWKFSVTLVLLAIAGYMGSEAGAHRKEERDAKRTQLDLNAIHPFLSQMDEADAAHLRKEFAQRVFSRPLANEKSQNGFRVPLLNFSREDNKALEESQKKGHSD